MLEQRSFDSIVFPGTVSQTALELREGLTKDEWLEAGKLCALVERADRWWIGDWLNYGERSYGETYSDGIALFEMDYGSLAICKHVASRIESLRRRKDLSWSHHYEVAQLPPDDQDHWLDLAAEQHWTREELRRRIKGPKAIPEPGSMVLEDAPLLRFSQDLPTATIVTLMLRVFFPDARTALDATYGSGAFWDGSAHVEVTAHDVEPGRAPHGAADFTDLSDRYPNGGDFDVVVFDPPHLADAGSESIMRAKYGTYSNDELHDVIAAGTREVWRVARQGVIVKVTDHSHSLRFQMESDWVRGALDWLPPYDVVHQVRSGALIDPKWDEQCSAYNNGSTYLVFRKGDQRHIKRR